MLYAKWTMAPMTFLWPRPCVSRCLSASRVLRRSRSLMLFDNGAWHVVAMEDETPIGTGRLYIDDGKFTIGRPMRAAGIPQHGHRRCADAPFDGSRPGGRRAGAVHLGPAAALRHVRKIRLCADRRTVPGRQHSACNHDGKGGGSAVSRRLRRQLWRRLQRLCGLRRLMIGLEKRACGQARHFFIAQRPRKKRKAACIFKLPLL